jgi:hypothetical protein
MFRKTTELTVTPNVRNRSLAAFLNALAPRPVLAREYALTIANRQDALHPRYGLIGKPHGKTSTHSDPPMSS